MKTLNKYLINNALTFKRWPFKNMYSPCCSISIRSKTALL